MLVKWPERRHFFLILGAPILIVVVTVLMLLNSEPYEFAKSFATQDARVLQITGTQTRGRLSPFKGFRYAFGDRTGEANFTFVVTGDRGRFDVRVVLEKREGRWSVIRAQTVSSSDVISDIVSTERP